MQLFCNKFLHYGGVLEERFYDTVVERILEPEHEPESMLAFH